MESSDLGLADAPTRECRSTRWTPRVLSDPHVTMTMTFTAGWRQRLTPEQEAALQAKAAATRARNKAEQARARTTVGAGAPEEAGEAGSGSSAA